MFVPGRIMRLITDGLDTTIHTETIGGVRDRRDRMTSARLMAVAPRRSANCSRSGSKSTTNVWLAPRMLALIAASSPTGPAPNIATVLPGDTCASSVP
jgi:hypothetical protein